MVASLEELEPNTVGSALFLSALAIIVKFISALLIVVQFYVSFDNLC